MLKQYLEALQAKMTLWGRLRALSMQLCGGDPLGWETRVVESCQRAMLESMTPGERMKPEIVSQARMLRIARGSGQTLAETQSLIGFYIAVAGRHDRRRRRER